MYEKVYEQRKLRPSLHALIDRLRGARGECVAAFVGSRPCEGFSSLNANACTSVLLDFHFCVLIPGCSYIAWNKERVAHCRMRSGSAYNGVKLGLLPVNHMGRSFLIFSAFVLVVELIGGSAFVVKILSFLVEF